MTKRGAGSHSSDMTRVSRVLVASVLFCACDLGLPSGDDGDEGGEDESGDEPSEESGDEASEESGDEASEESGDEASEASSEGAVDDTGAAEIPEELLGAWVIPGSVAASVIAFADDGSFARANAGELGGSCTTTIERMSAGTFVVEGDVVALHALEGLKRTDMCGTVTEEPWLPADEELTWQVGQDEWGENLTLTDATGYAAVYHRE
jgi:hypothetical protein